MTIVTFSFVNAAAQADLCRLLAACYYEPGAEFTQEKVFDSMIVAARCIAPDLAQQAEQLKADFEGESTENLLVDYARLFLGPVGTLAPPYESAWREQASGSPIDPTRSLVDLYEAGGFEMDPEFRDLPDHIAVELEFLYTLLFRIAAAVQSGDQPAIDHALALRRPLLDQHLACWIKPFTAALRENAACGFYRRLADLTAALVAMENAAATA